MTTNAPYPTSRLRIAMGTWVAVEAKAPHGPGTEAAAIEAAYAALSGIEQVMHPRRPGSDLERISTVPLHTPVRIQPDTWHLLQLARRLYDLTDGVFDPCLPEQPGRLADVELARDSMLVCHAPVEIDLGGIAKGYAVDRAIEKLIEAGCSAGLVNAGGDLRVFGDREEAVLLRRTASYRQLALRNAALAISDLDATDRPIEHNGYYNRTGSDPTCRYAAVIAKSAAIADALTKCVLLCSPERAAQALEVFEATSLTSPAPDASSDSGRAR
jgi:thiamine biosynthesis lipoprotein